MHEIVTIQLGRSANFVATHYWNTQESYHTFPPAPASIIDHDVHFRQGVAPDGTETYLPRTLIYDLKAGFGSLARTNVLGSLVTDESMTDTLWDGALTRLPQAPQPESSPYAKSLTNMAEMTLPTISTTQYFADFASTYYHPRSLIPITPPYPVTSSQSQPTAFATSGTAQTSSFEAGSDLFTARDKSIDILDTDLRLWIEECDGLQAVQIFTSSNDPWAGFATRYIERLRDELGKGCIWVWGIDGTATAYEPSHERKRQARQRDETINTALTVHGVAEHASMFVPLSIPESLPRNVEVNRRSLWHTSAFLESAIESSTLPTRLKGTESTLRDWQDVLSDGGRRTVAQLSFDTDFEVSAPERDSRMKPREGEEHVVKTTAVSDAKIDLALSFRPKRGQSTRFKQFSKMESFRGPQDVLDKLLAVYQPPSRGSFIETYCVPLDFSLLPSYPKIFTGFPEGQGLRIQTRMETNSGIAQWVRSLQTSIRSSAGSGSSIGGEEREAVYNSLGDIAEKYIEDWDSFEESDDDD